MANDLPRTHVAFENQLLTVGASSTVGSAHAMSPTFPMAGNRVAFAAAVKAIQAGVTVTFYLETSYTGDSWIPGPTASIVGTLGLAENSGTGAKTSFARLRAAATGTVGSAALFDASIVLSTQ